MAVAEQGEDVVHATLEHAAHGGEFPAALVAFRSGQVADQFAHHTLPAAPILAPVGAHDPLAGVVGEHGGAIGLDGEQGHEPSAAALPEVFVAGEQGSPAVVEPVSLTPRLPAAAHLGDAGGGQLHDGERLAGLDRVGRHGFDGLLPTGEHAHGDHLDESSEFVAARVQPFAQHLGRTARHHVREPGGPAIGMRGQIDGHGHVPVVERAVAPHALAHADYTRRTSGTSAPDPSPAHTGSA